MSAAILYLVAAGCFSAGFVAGAIWLGIFRNKPDRSDDRWSDYP